MCAKGRHTKGETHGMATLSDSDIVQIRLLKQSGMRQRAIASRYQISEGHVSNIISRKRRNH